MNAKEIHKLRKKFIITAMAAFTLVIAVLAVFINTADYVMTQREIDWSLERIAELREKIEEENTHSEALPGAPSFTEVFSPRYQSNVFYIISYDGSGGVKSFYASKGNSYPEEIVIRDAEEMLSDSADSGRYGVYYYLKSSDDSGGASLIILDCGSVIFSRMRLKYASIAIGAVSLIASLILVMIFSKKMIRPEIESSQRQMQFITNISHELKTPLAVIRSNAEMEEMTKGESEFMQSTVRQVDRMNALVKNLVMITRARETEDRSSDAEVNVSKIAEETVNEFSGMAEGKNIGIETSPGDGIMLKADESKVRQLMTILLDNAVKYCDENGSIFVGLEGHKKGIRLTVSNSYADGKDIDCKRFFDRFYREDNSRNIDTGGYGIGLSIAESICGQYGGDIQAQWQNGRISFVCCLISEDH